MNKDQFAYLNEEIEALKVERDSLKAQLEKAVSLGEKTQTALTRVCQERDESSKREAELRAELEKHDKDHVRIESELVLERNRWRQNFQLSHDECFKWLKMALDLAESLKTIKALNNTGHYIEGEPGHENKGCVASDIAEKALDEFAALPPPPPWWKDSGRMFTETDVAEL